MRVVVIAPGAPAAEAVRRALRYAGNLRVIGWVTSSEEGLQQLAQAAPDVVVLDAWLDRTATAFQVRVIRNAVPDAKLVLLVPPIESATLGEWMTAGADGAVLKLASPASVGLLVREIAAGNVCSVLPARPREPAIDVPAQLLTRRELEILRLVASGLSNSRIATRVCVTEQTVKFHLSNVYRKLGVSNRTEASHYAHVRGLLEREQAVLSVAA